MADSSAAPRLPPPGTSLPAAVPPPSDHKTGFVQPSSYLRPQNQRRSMTSRSEKQTDKDEKLALRAIRNFLKVRTSYDVLPLSFRLIIFDTALTVKESLNILVQNGNLALEKLEQFISLRLGQGIVSAPLWDSSSSTFAGLLTTSDYMNVIQYYWQNPAALVQIDKFLLSKLRDVERALGVVPPETVSIDPEKPLYEACRKMLKSRARRIPLISLDSQTGRTMVTSVITQYRILKFVAVNVGDTTKLRKPLRTLRLGSFDDLCTASMDTSVIEVIHEMVKRSISSVPIVTSQNTLLNVFEAVDVIALIKGGDYEALQLSVGEALRKRPLDYAGIYTCSMEDGLDTIFETIRKSRVHRLMIIDEFQRLEGLLSLSDILEYILLEGESEELADL